MLKYSAIVSKVPSLCRRILIKFKIIRKVPHISGFINFLMGSSRDCFAGIEDKHSWQNGNFSKFSRLRMTRIRPLEYQLSVPSSSVLLRPPNSPALIWAYREGIALPSVHVS
jgi:hypothetical protein